MPTWLRTALQYAPLAGRGLARFVRRLRDREAPSLEDAREANERAEKAIDRERARLVAAGVTPQSIRPALRRAAGMCACGHSRSIHDARAPEPCMLRGCSCDEFRLSMTSEDTPTESPRSKRGG